MNYSIYNFIHTEKSRRLASIFKTIAVATAIATGTTSCSDIIDKEPILDTSESSIFSSKSQITNYLEGVYKRLGDALPGYFYTTDMRGDEFEDLVQNGSLNSYEMNVPVSGSSSEWNNLYKAIGEANDFLNNLADVKDIVGEDYERFRSEALFVRALSHYYLVVLYARTYHLNPSAKAVPIRIGTDATSGNNLAASTIEQVHQQIFEDVSNENISHLSTERNSLNGVTHATQAAAHALRQRLYMERWDWDNVIEEGKKIADFNYDLRSLTSIFTSPYYTEESILSFPYSVNNKNSLGSNFYLANGRALEDTYSGIYALPLYSQEADIRKSSLTVKPNSHITISKYTDVSSGTDWIPVFRYAETLLNLSEAYYNKGDEGKAKEYLSRVRRRSIASDDDALDIESLTGEELKDAIYNERRLEFVGEGLRSIDIHRRGDVFDKRRGAVHEIVVKPTDDGYIYPIPLSETSQNSLIRSEN